jgi:hypothetical protein
MNVVGIDLTSRPGRRKPITALHCLLADGVLRPVEAESWTRFEDFEAALARPGPWIAGIDFPFGQSRKFIETIGWPASWAEYVAHAGALGRRGFRRELDSYRAGRPEGDKEHRRATDVAAGSVSPQKLYGVPVGLMFFEGAPRLLRSGVTIPHMLDGDPDRIVVEAYPGCLARRFIGRQGYKHDTRAKQTEEQARARVDLLDALRTDAAGVYGFDIEPGAFEAEMREDPTGDRLDALLCAVQAGWAWTQRHEGFGAARPVDTLEGWIADPGLCGAGAADDPDDRQKRREALDELAALGQEMDLK